MSRFGKLLVPLDVLGPGFRAGQELTVGQQIALHEACRRVRDHGAALTLLTVVESHDTPEVRAAAAELLRHGVAAALGDTPAELAVAVGRPATEIIRHVLAAGTELVLLPSRRPSLLERAIVGSTGMNVLRQCPCPIWVTGRRATSGPLVVLTALGSEGLRDTLLAHSVALLSERGGSWHVLHCLEDPEVTWLHLRRATREEHEARRAVAREEAWQKLAQWTAGAQVAGLVPQLLLAEGHPAEQIVHAAAAADVDVVVLGSVGRAGVPGLLVGHTAEKVFRHVDCGMLVIKPEGFVSPVGL